MACRELVVVVLAVCGCHDRCQPKGFPPAPASKALESVSEESPGQSAAAVRSTEPTEPTEPGEPPAPQPPAAPPLARAQVAPPVAPQVAPQVAPRVAPPTVEPRQPIAEAPPPHVIVEQQLAPAPVQVMPTVAPQYNDAGVLVPAVPLWIDPGAPPGTPGNGAPDMKTTGSR